MSSIDRIRSYIEVIRLTPYDTSTEYGRSKERYRLIALSSLTSLFAKLITSLLGLITVPLTINYLGKEQFGLWMIVSSLIVWMQLADFGVSNGLTNAISEANGKDDKQSAQAYVSTSIAVLTAISIVLIIPLTIIAFLLPWETILKLPSVDLSILASRCFFIAGIAFTVNIPLSVFSRIFIAYQRSYIPNLMQILSAIISLIGILIAIKLNLGLVILVLLLSVAPITSNILMFIILKSKLPWCCFKRSMIRMDAWKRVAQSSIPLFGYQICSMFITNFVNIVIARLGSLDMVADYNILFKVYLVIFMVGSSCSASFYPAIREAYEKGEILWVRSSIRKLIIWRLTPVLLLALPMIFFGDKLIKLWIKQGLSHQNGMVGWIFFLLCLLIYSLFSSMSEIMMGLDDINAQTIALLISTVLTIISYYILIPEYGVMGVFLANFVGIVLPTIYLILRLKNRYLTTGRTVYV